MQVARTLLGLDGRIGRAAFGYGAAAVVALFSLAFALSRLALPWLADLASRFGLDAPFLDNMAWSVLGLVLGWTLVALAAKRLRDRGRTPWWIVVVVVPLAALALVNNNVVLSAVVPPLPMMVQWALVIDSSLIGLWVMAECILGESRFPVATPTRPAPLDLGPMPRPRVAYPPPALQRPLPPLRTDWTPTGLTLSEFLGRPFFPRGKIDRFQFVTGAAFVAATFWLSIQASLAALPAMAEILAPRGINAGFALNVIWLLLGLALVWCLVSLSMKRLRDRGRSPWWAPAAVVPLALLFLINDAIFLVSRAFTLPAIVQGPLWLVAGALAAGVLLDCSLGPSVAQQQTGQASSPVRLDRERRHGTSL